jgi:hypothetical protein
VEEGCPIEVKCRVVVCVECFDCVSNPALYVGGVSFLLWFIYAGYCPSPVFPIVVVSY